MRIPGTTRHSPGGREHHDRDAAKESETLPSATLRRSKRTSRPPQRYARKRVERLETKTKTTSPEIRRSVSDRNRRPPQRFHEDPRPMWEGAPSLKLPAPQPVAQPVPPLQPAGKKQPAQNNGADDQRFHEDPRYYLRQTRRPAPPPAINHPSQTTFLRSYLILQFPPSIIHPQYNSHPPPTCNRPPILMSLLFSLFLLFCQPASSSQCKTTRTNHHHGLRRGSRVSRPPQRFHLPGPPLELRIINVQSDTMSLTWLEPDFDGGSPVQGYFLEKRDKISKRWLKIEKDMLTTTTYKVGGLIEGFSYEFRVSAKNVVGTGPPSEPTFPTVARPPLDPPDPPLEPHVVDQTRSTVDLEWDEPVYDGSLPIEGYLVEHRLKGVETWTKSHDTSMVANMYYTVAGLEEGREYQFRVFAINGAGKSKPAEVPGFTVVRDITIYPEIELDASCKDTVYARANQNVRLPVYIKGRPDPKIMWSKEGKDLPGHITIEKLAIVELVVPSLLTGQKYVFRVCAANRAGHGPWEAVPGTILIKEREEPLVLNLDASFKELYVLRAGSVLRIPVMIGGRPEPKIEWFKEGQKTHGRTLIENTAISTTLLIKNCYKSDAGEYMLRISNQSGKKECRVQVRVVDKPSVPLNLRSKPEEITSDMIPLYWDAPEDDGGAKITHYIVEKREAKRAAWASVCNTVRTTCIAPELVEKMVYEFRVRAVNEIGEGENALSGKIRCQPPLSPPGPPLMLDVEDTSKDSILLDWDPPREDGGSKILGYFVEMKGPEDTDWRKVNMESFTSSRWEVKGLRDDVDYDFQVKATNAIGVGPPSEPITGARCFELPSAPAIDLAISMRDLVVVKAGTPIKLHARIEGYPYPSAQWLSKRVVKAGTPIKLHARIEGYPYPSAQWLSKRVVKAGTPIKLHARIEGYPYPSAQWLSKRVVKAGTPIKLHARIEGYPYPSAQWLSKRVVKAGTPIKLHARIEGYPYPSAQWLSKRVVKAGTPIKLHARIEGYPYPSAQWLSKGEPLEAGDRYSMKTTKSTAELVVKPSLRSDTGRYHLVVKNLAGTRKAPINVKVTGLNEGYSYFFRVKAENKYGIGMPVETTEPTLAADPIDRPTEPRDLEVTAVTNNSVSLKWVKPTYDGGSPLTTYLVERCRLGESDHTRINTHSIVEVNDGCHVSVTDQPINMQSEAQVYEKAIKRASTDGLCMALGQTHLTRLNQPPLYQVQSLKFGFPRGWTAEKMTLTNTPRVHSLSIQLHFAGNMPKTRADPVEVHYELPKQRQVYWEKAHASLDDPTAVLSIIIKVMDRNKTAIHHFALTTNAVCVNRLKEPWLWRRKNTPHTWGRPSKVFFGTTEHCLHGGAGSSRNPAAIGLHRALPAADKLPAVALPHLLADVLDATKHLSRLFQYRDITCSTLGTQVELRLVNNSFLSHCQRAGPDQVCNPWNQETQNTKLIMVKIQQPTTHQKATSNPQPVNQQPVTQQPVNPQQQPVIKQPVTQQPVNPQPTTRQPATHNQQPVTQQPVNPQPTTRQPATRQPATHNPSTSNPSPSNPSTHNPSTSNPSPSNPSASNPSTSNPQPATHNPSTHNQQPVNQQPTTRQPATHNQQPTTRHPATHHDPDAMTNEAIDNLDLDTSDRLVVVVL
ncbi:Titin-like [Branchiostoma belcheri]|nr:Titin-like [Branchiostoma belcheri]